MADRSSLSLPGDAAPSRREVTVAGGQLAKLVAPAAVAAVADATLDCLADQALVEQLHGLAGLGDRQRRLTPFALRAIAIAVDEGHFATHEALRLTLPLAADQDLGTDAYKYQGFYQEAVVATMHTQAVNQSRWDAHHLWHTTHGLLWEPEMTRGTMYVSARLNEAACEAHWYFLDAIRGPRCGRHQTVDLRSVGTDTFPSCVDCDQTRERASDAEAHTLARGAIGFWDGEAAEVDLFRQTHRVMRTVNLGHRVDLWREAFDYVQHHRRRLGSTPFTAYVEFCLTAGVDYEVDAESFRDQIATRLARLLLAPVEVDVARARIRQGRRLLQDVGGRLLQLAHLGRLQRAAIEPVASAIQALTPLAEADGPATAAELASARAAAWAALDEVGRDPNARDALCVGYDFATFLGPAAPASSRASVIAAGPLADQLQQTLAANLPLTTAAAARLLGSAALARLVVAEPSFRAGLGRLTKQVIAALAGHPPLTAVARYEDLLARAGTTAGALHEDLYAVAVANANAAVTDDTRVRLNPSLEQTVLAYDPRHVMSGGESEPRPTHVWVGWFLGAGFVEIDNGLAPLADRLRRPRSVGSLDLPADQIRDLVARRLLVVVTPQA